MDSLSGIILEAPRMIQNLAAVLKEMLVAAAPMKGYPNETADYWDEKDDIISNQGRIATISE